MLCMRNRYARRHIILNLYQTTKEEFRPKEGGGEIDFVKVHPCPPRPGGPYLSTLIYKIISKKGKAVGIIFKHIIPDDRPGGALLA